MELPLMAWIEGYIFDTGDLEMAYIAFELKS